jgi:hypothetical protein
VDNATVNIPVLPAFYESFIKVCSDDSLVQLRTANVLHAIQGILMVVVLDKTEAARSLLEAIEAHNQSFDLSTLGEELVDLFFRCIEGPGALV